MFESPAGRLFLSLFKAGTFLAVGSGIGFFLGLAYASYLYGTPPVVMQIESWLAGDSLFQEPIPSYGLNGEVAPQASAAGVAGNFLSPPVSLIPQIGALIGFGISASVLIGSLLLRSFFSSGSVSGSENKSAGSGSVNAKF